MGVARIVKGLQDKLFLGNLDAKRDWGHAKDYVRMMWMILQYDKAEDWVIATENNFNTRSCKMAFNYLDIELEFVGKGINEKAFVKYCKNSNYQIEIGKEVLNIDPNYFRPNEVDLLIGDSTKAKEKLGWKAETKLEELIQEMVFQI